jgi:Cu/Ag efflux pump CusA
VLITIPMYLRLGSEFMPPLNEGAILYMPITLPESPANNGAFGTDYYHRTGAVKADPYDNKRKRNDVLLHR